MAAAAALAPDYIDIEDAAHDYNHNTSSQRHVVVNDDPVLRKDREHHHGHLHHSANTEKGREDDLAYSKGTTFEESTIPHQDPQDHNLHRRHHADNTKEPTGIVDPEHVGMFVQFIIALFVLRSGVGYNIFDFISELARDLLGFANQGVIFLTAASVPKLGWFLVSTLPAVVFFVALVQLLFYNGILQWFIVKFAVFFFWSMRVSGAESVVAAASPFIGQGESAMLIKPFVAHLTKAELHQVMCSGFATIAGSVLIAYISLGVNPQALVSSCVMSIPASLAISKLRYPETEETLTTGRVVIPDDDEHRAANSLHAFANGAWLGTVSQRTHQGANSTKTKHQIGLKIAGMILATLLCIIALLGLANGLLTWWGRYLNINNPPLTVELIVGYICYPIAFLLGVPRNGDLLKVAQLIGTKLIANEFVAYTALQTDPAYADLSPRSRLIATYALCGFANIGSLGTQIGVLSQIAPGRSGDVSRLALSALIAGALSTLTSASIAGLLVTNQAAYFTPSTASS
ncbi:hypothetical protein MMC28_004456 [Mycoblastus sanguinarius]|nr:hypothetical protein [Mycoblastus sanguinarius]